MLKSTREAIQKIIMMQVADLPEDATEQDRLLHEAFFLDQVINGLSARARGAQTLVGKKAERPSYDPEPGQTAVIHHLYYDLVVFKTIQGQTHLSINSMDDGAVEATKKSRAEGRG